MTTRLRLGLVGCGAIAREHVAALTDDQDLLAPRRSPHGPERQTRWVVTTMIEHELYHAGEINHVRLLFHGNDG